ncbi:MAG: site-specific integrase [Bacteroidia bacterium]|nr:site-specific integrase [Bacteroidia bacterium]
MTFHFELGNHPNKNGDYTIFLSLYHKGERKRLKTTIIIPSKCWDPEKERVKKTCPTSKQDNDELQRLLDKARVTQRELLSQDNLTMLRFLDRFQGKELSFKLISYAQHTKEVLQQGKQWGTFKKYGDTLNKLIDYIQTLGVNDVDFRDVTPMFIKGFTSFLQSLPNRRDPSTTLSPNSIAKHLKVIRAILNRAVDDGIIHADDIPRKLISVKETPPAITGLRDAELTKLITLPMKEHSDQWDARNLFLFAMYEGGIRIGDIIQLRWRNIVGDRLIYTMTKNGKKVDVILVQDAEKILKLYKKPGQRPSHYIFPYLDNDAEYAKYLDYEDREKMPLDVSRKYFDTINAREARIGRMLREIRSIAGIPHLTFHTARHTFALRARDAHVDNTTLKNILQHSSLSTTETYVKKLDCSSEDAAMKVMYLDKTHHNKEKKRIVKQIQKLGLTPEELIELLSGH